MQESIALFPAIRETQYNLTVNGRQFGGLRGMMEGVRLGGGQTFLPADTPAPDLSFRDRTRIGVGGIEIELRPQKGAESSKVFCAFT